MLLEFKGITNVLTTTQCYRLPDGDIMIELSEPWCLLPCSHVVITREELDLYPVLRKFFTKQNSLDLDKKWNAKRRTS